MIRGAIAALLVVAWLAAPIGTASNVAAAPAGHSAAYAGKVRPVAPAFPSYYSITAQGYSCTSGGIACLPPDIFACQNGSTCPGLNYGDAEAYGAVANANSGTPGDLYLECDRYTDSGYQQAVLDVVSNTGVSAYGPGGIFGFADNGTIGGKGTLLGPPPYDDTDTGEVSSISASGYDPTTRTTGSATGTQNTDNGPETQNEGQISITIRGTIQNYDASGKLVSARTGTMSCVAGGSDARQVGTAMGEASLRLFYP